MNKTKMKENIRNFLIIVVTYSLLSVWGGILLFSNISDIIYKHAQKQVATYAEEVSKHISDNLRYEMLRLQETASYLELQPTGKRPDFAIDTDTEKYGLLQVNGKPVWGSRLNVTMFRGISDSIHGNPSVCHNFDGQILFTIPVYRHGNVHYVLYKLYEAETCNKFIGENNLKDSLAILDSSGMCLAKSQTLKEISKFPKDDEIMQAMDKIQENLNLHSASAVRVNLKSGNIYAFATEIEYTDWYLTGSLPERSVLGNLQLIVPLMVWIFALISVLMGLITLYFLNADKKAKESDELRKAKTTAEIASKAKSDFLANIFHEIRTPISEIVDMNELVLKETQERDILKYSSNIGNASHSLLNILNNILVFSKIESGQMNIVNHCYSLHTVLKNVIDETSAQAEHKNLEFHVQIPEDLPDQLLGDDIKVSLVLTNLLENAVKYTSFGYVSFCVSCEMSADTANFQFRVKDSGNGFKDEDIKQLFDNLQQYNLKENKHSEGTGIGLAVANKIALMLGGKMDFKSKIGKGSEFIAYIPQKIVEEQKNVICSDIFGSSD